MEKFSQFFFQKADELRDHPVDDQVYDQRECSEALLSATDVMTR